VKETILQSVGAHNKTEDQDFDDKCNKFTSFSRDLTKVHLAMQLWLDSIDLMCASCVGIGESLSNFTSSGDSTCPSPVYRIAKAFESIGSDVNIALRQNMRTIFIDRCLRPIESILAIVPIVNEKIQQRKNLLLDSDFYKSKRRSEIQSGKDPDHPVVAKLTTKLNEANKSLEAITSDVVNCIDELVLRRPEMLSPELAATVACMEGFFASTSAQLSQLLPLIPQSASTTCLLAASLESHKPLKSSETLEELLASKEKVEVAPVFYRTGACGGTSGGYGHVGFEEGVGTTIDVLLHSTDSSTQGGGDRESVCISRDSNLSSPRASSPISSRIQEPTHDNQQQRIVSTKRAVIKLGAETPVTGSTSSGESLVSGSAGKRKSVSVLGSSPARPASMSVTPQSKSRMSLSGHTAREIRSMRLAAAATPRDTISSGKPFQTERLERSPTWEGDEEREWSSTSFDADDGKRIVPTMIRVPTHSSESAASLAEDGVSSQSCMSTASPSASKNLEKCKISAGNSGNKVVALYKYESDVEGDLRFQRNDIIEVVSRDDSGWWTGRIGDKVGSFPSNYVKDVDSA